MPDAIRVAVVDDHPVFRMGMAGLLDSLEGISVVGQAADAAAALALPLAEIDVVLMDLHLGEDSGIDTTREIVRRSVKTGSVVATLLERRGRDGLDPGHAGRLTTGASRHACSRPLRSMSCLVAVSCSPSELRSRSGDWISASGGRSSMTGSTPAASGYSSVSSA